MSGNDLGLKALCDPTAPPKTRRAPMKPRQDVTGYWPTNRPDSGSHIHEGGGNTWMADVYVWVRWRERPFGAVQLQSEIFGLKTRARAEAWVAAELLVLEKAKAALIEQHLIT